LIYLDALDDRRGFQAIYEQNPLRNIEIKKEESSPHTVEEYIADAKRDSPSFVEIWSELWYEEISHSVKVNEAGVFVDRMLESVEKMMVDNLMKGYTPKRVEAKIPILSFYALKNPKLPNAYTDEQKAAFDQFDRNVAKPFSRSLISEFQNRFPHANIVVIPDGHHFCFIAQEELVHGEMRKFLLD